MNDLLVLPAKNSVCGVTSAGGSSVARPKPWYEAACQQATGQTRRAPRAPSRGREVGGGGAHEGSGARPADLELELELERAHLGPRLVSVDDGDGQPGRVPSVHHVLDVRLERGGLEGETNDAWAAAIALSIAIMLRDEGLLLLLLSSLRRFSEEGTGVPRER